MVQSSGCASLEQETLLCIGLRSEVRRKKLQGDVAPETFVTGLMDEPHAASPQRFEHRVLRYPAPLPIHGGDTCPQLCGRAYLLGKLIQESPALVTVEERLHFAA
jgi:hypothetical protein